MTQPSLPLDTDLLIIGGGAGGMATALAASVMGLQVTLCEKTSAVGGTAATSAGTLWIPGNRLSQEAGYADTVNDARTYLQHLIGSHDPGGVREAFLQTANEAVEFFQTHTAVQFMPCGHHPDYLSLPGAAVSGRAIIPQPFDGRLLGRAFAHVRPPIDEFMVLGGMMVGKADIEPLVRRFQSWPAFAHASRLFLRYLSDRLRHRRGTRLVMGNALVARLYHSLLQRGVTVHWQSALNALHIESGHVTGATLKQGQTLHRINARLGVVLATGGIGHHAAWRAQALPSPVASQSLAAEGNTGDGLDAMVAVGAAVNVTEQAPGAFWTPVSAVRRANGSQGWYPHLSLDRAKPGLIAVNAAGQRFVNEADSYHDFVQGMYRRQANGEASIPAFLIVESRFIERYGLGAIHPGTKRLQPWVDAGYLWLQPTLHELARAAGIDAAALQATVALYNTDAKRGLDTTHGKGSSELNRFNGDPAHPGPNPCLAPIEQGPFVALRVWPADIGTSAGATTNANGQVLNDQGAAIGGMYAVGGDMASVMQGTYPGPGTTLGPALTFGYRIARHAAQLRSTLP